MHDGHRRRLLAAATVLLLAAPLIPSGGASAAPLIPSGGASAAPLIPSGRAGAATALAPLYEATGPTVPGGYIVVLRPKPTAATPAAVSRAAALGAKVERRYRSALNGFSAKLTAVQLAALRKDPDVAFVSPDHRVELDTTQLQATWGLDRVDQRARQLDRVYEYHRTGTGVTVYVIDTGVRATHNEFGGRVGVGYNAFDDGSGNATDTDDCVGHGTHVAGTVGSATYGVAKNVRIVPVRVFECSRFTTSSAIITGVDWVTADHSGPSVANMSLGGPGDYAIDWAVSNSIASGITYVVSAGNDYRDACDASPARVPEAITVGAADSSDRRWYLSNYGACVDILAPGVDVLSASHRSDWETTLATGTSMASPHVAGAAALYLQDHQYPWHTPATAAQWLTDNATAGALSDLAGSPNRLLHIHPPAEGVGMTWTVKQQRPDDVVQVGADSRTDAYRGDHGAGAVLPMLCLRVTDAPVPPGVTPDSTNGWAYGSVQLTPPISGTQLTSYAEAGRLCAATFGAGWRMAEFHDGVYDRGPPPPALPRVLRSGWNFTAHGTLPAGTRFWVAINDQPANVWDRW